jgi:hypothetical protein
MTDNEENQLLAELADKTYGTVGELIIEGHTPLAVAAILTMISLQIYRTTLSEEDYNQMVHSIWESRHKVKKLTDIAKDLDPSKFH